MFWTLLMYVILPLAVIALIRRRRAKRLRLVGRDATGKSLAEGFSSDIVLITGGAQGIGKELAYKFGEQGAKLILWDINETKLRATRRELDDTGYETHAYVVDCADKRAVLEAAAKVKEEVGEVTVLVNNAGNYAGKMILQMEDDDLENTLKINLLAHFWTVRAFLPSMLENNHGYIVAMASVAAFTNLPSLLDYTASKAAQVSFAKTLQAEIILANKPGVTVTCVCPATVDTGFADRYNFPGLLGKNKKGRVMTVEAAAERIIEAIASREFVVIFPRKAAVVAFFLTIMPSSLLKWLYWRIAKKLPVIDLATGRETE